MTGENSRVDEHEKRNEKSAPLRQKPFIIYLVGSIVALNFAILFIIH
jgi:hypothetical protein